jgi:hypothetical protein
LAGIALDEFPSRRYNISRRNVTKETTMSARLFSKGRTPEIPEPDEASEPRSLQEQEPEEELDSEREAAALLRTRIPEVLQAIGGNLDRTLSVLQRMERRLGAFTQ